MATEERKKENMLRLTRASLLGLSAGVWNLVGEGGALGLNHEIGNVLLPVLEKEMGLEIAGEEPELVLQEIGRLLVDEFGVAGSVEVTRDGDTLTMKVHSCTNRSFSDQLMSVGVSKPFVCPFMAIFNAVLDRIDMKAMSTIEKWDEGKGAIITFELI